MNKTAKLQQPSAVVELATALARILLPRIKNHIDEKFFVFETKLNKTIKNLLIEQQNIVATKKKKNRTILFDEDEDEDEDVDEDVEGYANKLGNQLGLIGREDEELDEDDESDFLVPKSQQQIKKAISNGHIGMQKINEERKSRIVSKVKKNLGIDESVMDLIMSAEEPINPNQRYAQAAINEHQIASVDVNDIVNNNVDANEVVDPLQIDYSKLVEKMDKM